MFPAILVNPDVNAKYELVEVGRQVDRLKTTERQRAFLREKMALAESVGLTSQAEMLSAEILELERPGLDADPMSAQDIAVWKAFLPRTYNLNRVADTRLGGHKWVGDAVNYRFDRVPMPVLQRLKSHQDDGVIERFEIWTPEKVEDPDPMLVGYIGKRCYMLARWAESDANVMDLKSVKHLLLKRFFWERYGLVSPLFVAVVLSLAVSFFSALALADKPVNGWAILEALLTYGMWVGMLLTSVLILWDAFQQRRFQLLALGKLPPNN